MSTSDGWGSETVMSLAAELNRPSQMKSWNGTGPGDVAFQRSGFP
jgi:hypothetical protein